MGIETLKAMAASIREYGRYRRGHIGSIRRNRLKAFMINKPIKDDSPIEYNPWTSGTGEILVSEV